MIGSAITLGLCVSFLAAEPSSTDFVPENYVAESALAFVDVKLDPPTLEAARGTSLWKLWQHPETQRFLEKPIRQMRKDYEAWLAMAESEVGVDLRPILALMPPRRVAFALNALDAKTGGPQSLLVLIDLGSGAKEMEATIDRAIEAVKKKSPEAVAKFEFTERESQGTRIRRSMQKSAKPGTAASEAKPGAAAQETAGGEESADAADGEIPEGAVVRDRPSHDEAVFEWAFQGSVLFISMGEVGDLESLRLEHSLRPEKPLSAEEDFKLVRARFGSGTPFVFVRIDRIIEAGRKARKLLIDPSEGASSKAEREKDLAEVDSILRLTGVSSIRSLAWVQSFEGRDIVDRFFVGAPEPREGLLFDMLSAPLPAERLARFAPKTAQVYGEMSMDLPRLWQSVTKMVDQVGGDETKASFAKGLAAFEAKLGAKVTDFLACFKPQMAGYSTMPASLSGLGEQGLILPLADPARFRDILAKVRALPEVNEYLIFDDEVQGGMPTVKITFKNLPLPIMPTYALIEDTLVVAESPLALQKLAKSLEQKSGSLLDSEKYRSMAARAFPPGAQLGEYMDMAGIVERLYGLVVSVLNMSLGAPEARSMLDAFGIDMNLLPSAKAVAGGLGLGYEYARLDAAGIEYGGRSAFGAGIVGVYKTAVAAVLPFAGMAQLRETVKDSESEVSRKNLERLHEACLAYRKTVGGDRHPGNLLALVNADLVEPEVLALACDKDRKTVEDPESGESVVVSYRYRLEGWKSETPSLVIWEAGAWRDGKSRLGLLSDGAIITIWSDEELQALLRGESRR